MSDPGALATPRASREARRSGLVLSRIRTPEWALAASAGGLGLLLRAGWFAVGEPRAGARLGRDAIRDTARGGSRQAPPCASAQASRGAASAKVSGWRALRRLRWALLAASLGGSAACLLQASRRAPAVPVAATVLVMVEGALTAPFLLRRVALAPPGCGLRPRLAAWAALACALAVPASAYWSLRRDGIRPEDGPPEIETVAP
jgi:hypothetical protein